MAGGAPSVLRLSLLLLVCSAVVTNAKPYWRSGHHSGGHYSPAGAWAGALPSPRLGAEWNPLLHTSHHRYGHGHAHSGHHGGGRASAMAGAGGPWAAITGGRGAWAVSGGGSGGPWAVTSGGRAGPWAVTGDGRRHSLYAMNGVAWPGVRQPAVDPYSRWGHHFGHHWQVVRTPSLGHHGWGIYWAHNGRRDCDHQGRHRPEHQPEEEEDEEQPEEREEREEEEQPEDEDTPDDFDGSGFFPEVRFDFPRLPEITPSWPDFTPDEPEDTTPEAPEETPEPPQTTPPVPPQTPPPQPTQPEKTDCPEGAVFLDGECICPDSKPFLDTILSRCVDIKPVIH